MRALFLSKKTQILAFLGILLILSGLPSFSIQQPEDKRPADQIPSPEPDQQLSPEVVDPVLAPVITQNREFSHSRPEHKRQECNYCHQRANNNPTPTFPYHPVCFSCHGNDFTSTSSQLCLVCHNMPVQTPAKVIGFPRKLKVFGLQNFSHKTHLDPAKMPAGTAVAKCDGCHRFDERVIEVSFPHHPECYSCHSHQAGQKFGGCTSCHGGTELALKYNPGLGPAYSQYNFKHGTHLKEPKIQNRCDKCHPVSTAIVEKTRSDIVQINASAGQRHKSTCWTCHTNAREALCSKCHVEGLSF